MNVDDEIVPSCAPLERSKDKECSWTAKDAEQGCEAEEDGDLDISHTHNYSSRDPFPWRAKCASVHVDKPILGTVEQSACG